MGNATGEGEGVICLAYEEFPPESIDGPCRVGGEDDAECGVEGVDQIDLGFSGEDFLVD